MEVVLIDSGGANIGSVRYALERLGVNAQLSADAETITRAERVILPGVGAAGAGMARLRELGLVDVVRNLSQPLLGICLGMQLLFESSEENETACLGLVPGRVRKLAAGEGIRVPHMGWNALQPRRDDALLAGVDTGAQAYFVHSYAAPVSDDTIATATHGDPFSAVVRRGRCWGAQFHPERSGHVGARLLENFLSDRLA
ncbi:imidazole glycerol phosphate synthase subunit HisH [Lysobacter solisilvae (ex Woo and Kim 2020)]|uniref:Imidazole glycerol phosphate synthase subunit HisH n=1 Tax=Agrilutibacter terrestris TaxID=2865112 RepID=A0A7H0FWQ9_9GAMM|nr:imidazole glycerol phosphate synthase subunit HisH [Lysobacter terrestris]QNP40475.1 imidazole glycerol phosphate synthase subunit HisH [Lysobacter terrestris]